MANTNAFYLKGLQAAMNRELDFNSDAIKVALLTASYTPDRTAHDYFNDVSAAEASGTGYTAGGAALASPTFTATAANSLTAIARNTAYVVGQIRRPATGNTYAYVCAVAGTTHATTEPTMPTTPGVTVADGTVTWANCGIAVLKLDATDLTMSALTLSCRYAVIYDSTPGSDAARPLIVLVDLGSTRTLTADDLVFTWDATDGIANLVVN